MILIDWAFVARHTLWILGASILLATWSYASWWAGTRQMRIGQALGAPLFLVPTFGGLLLVSASLAWSADQWWERGVWLAMAAMLIWQSVVCWRQVARHGWDRPTGGESGKRS